MERLTARDPAGNAYFPECFKEPCGGGGCTKDHCEFFDQVCDKMAGYEEREEEEKKLLSESEEARAELGRRLADAQRELQEAKSELEKARDALDAAVRDLRGECFACEHVDTDCPAMDCRRGEKFKWRGPQKEDT